MRKIILKSFVLFLLGGLLPVNAQDSSVRPDSDDTELPEIPAGDYADYIDSDWDSPIAKDHNEYIEPGERFDLEAVLRSYSEPEKTVFKDEKVTWTVEDRFAEFIDFEAEGNILHITGKAGGLAEIKAEITNGSYAYYWVQVAPKVEKLSFNEDLPYVLPFEEYKRIFFEDYLVTEPAEAIGRQFTASVDNTSVLGGIFKTGLNYAEMLDTGTVTVTITPTDDPSLAVSHVFEIVDPADLRAPESMKALTDTAVTRYADYYYADLDENNLSALNVEYSPEGSRTDTVWKSSDPSIVSVYENIQSTSAVRKASLTVYKEGTVTVTASSKYNPDLVQEFTVHAVSGDPMEVCWKSKVEIGEKDSGEVRTDPDTYTMAAGKEYSLRIQQDGWMIPNLLKVRGWIEDLSIVEAYDEQPGMLKAMSSVSQIYRITLKPLKAGTETLHLGDRDLTLTVVGEAPETKMIAKSSETVTAYKDFNILSALKVAYEGNVEDETTEWISSDPSLSLAAINDSLYCGIIPKKAGTFTVTARNQANPELSVVFTVNVLDEIPYDRITTGLSLTDDGTSTQDLPEELSLDLDDEVTLMVSMSGTGYVVPSEDVFYNNKFLQSGLLEVTEVEVYSAFGGPMGHSTVNYIVKLKAVKEGSETMKIGEAEAKVRISAEAPVPESLTLSKDSVQTYVGYLVKLSASVLPEKADQTVTWSSDKPEIADVDQNGNVKAVKAGTAAITARTVNGIEAKCVIRVLFTDVPAEGVYYSAPVYWAVENGITNGYKDEDGFARTFRPQNNCTREAVVTFLWRLAGRPEPKSMTSSFPDVQDKSKYYYKAVLWAAEQGITAGYGDGTFKPNATCLREHVVTFLYRYAGKPEPKTAKNPFNDVKKSDYYYKAALWANENGIAKGYSTGAHAGGFGPKLDCLREHVVTFLYRYAG